MTSRLVFGLLSVATFCSAQNLPSFRWAQEIDASGMNQFAGIGTDAAGDIYVAGSTRSPNFPVKAAVQNHLASSGSNDLFITKLDSSGNTLFSTYFGGTGDDIATAMTVDSAGNVYVTGTTTSTDFPTTPGSYSPSVPPPPKQGYVFEVVSFVLKLNPDGAVGYSTYFSQSATKPRAIATDGAGSAYITGITYGDLTATPGAYKTSCPCTGGLYLAGTNDTFLARFGANGSQLIYSTYLGVLQSSGEAVVVAPDGSAYVGGAQGLYRISSTGDALLASVAGTMSVQALALAQDGSIYMAGLPQLGQFQPTPGAFQTITNPLPSLPSLPNRDTQLPLTTPVAIAKLDPQLQHILAGTYFYGIVGNWINSLALDAAGNLYAGGYTGPGLPMRTPLVDGFGAGFLSQFSGDLSSLLFSTYLGANTNFGVHGVAIGSNGSVVIGGPEIVGNSIVCASICDGLISTPANIWVNSLAITAPPALRVDSIVNAASFLDGPVSAGETILVRGAGFGADARLSIAGIPVPAISIGPSEIAATVPQDIPNGAAQLVVQSGGGASNQVLIPVATTSPGLFAANGNGYGQGYILNQDGTPNTPANPARPGDRITVYATGVGPMSYSGPFAVTDFPASLFINGIYCLGVAAFNGPIPGFAGDVYRLTMYVPNPPGYTFPDASPVILEMNGVQSQYGIAISVRQ